jgi:hypothetical protein
MKPGPNNIKLFTDVIYKCLQLVRVFVPGKPSQPNLMFVGKAWNLHQIGAPETID